MGVHLGAIIIGLLACVLFLGTTLTTISEKGLDRGAAVVRSFLYSLIGFVGVLVLESQIHPPCGETYYFYCSKPLKHATSGFLVIGYVVGCVVGAILSFIDWDEAGYKFNTWIAAKDAKARADQDFAAAKVQAYQDNTLVGLLSFQQQYNQRTVGDTDLAKRITDARIREEDADIAAARQTNTAAAYEAVLRKWGNDGRRQEEVTRFRDKAAADTAAAAKARADRERAEAEASEAAHQVALARNALRNALLTMIENAEWLASDDKTGIVIPARNAIRGELNKIERNPLITLPMLREPDTTLKLNELITLLRTNEGPDSLLLGSVIAALKIEQGLRDVAVGKQAV